MSYHHTDILSSQTSKIPGKPCGDVFGTYRNEFATIAVLSDGLGSGIKANIAANMCIARIFGLLKNGATLREAFSAMVRTMNKAWGTIEPFAVFSVMQILNNGNVTVLTYEMPPPILVNKHYVKILSDRVYTISKAIISEVNTKIDFGEGIMLVSDGITQAGLGCGLVNGWEIEGVKEYLNRKIVKIDDVNQDIVDAVHHKALGFWGRKKGDDCTVILAKTRSGIVVNLFSGPPENKEDDKKVVERFNNTVGIKIVCGGSTAKIVARELKKNLEVDMEHQSMITPPSYSISGINLVTEGVVTLNQVFNILDEDIDEIEDKSNVVQFTEYLLLADRINIFSGSAKNTNDESIEFRQQGILNRKKILNLLAKKLDKTGKLIVRYDF